MVSGGACVRLKIGQREFARLRHLGLCSCDLTRVLLPTLPGDPQVPAIYSPIKTLEPNPLGVRLPSDNAHVHHNVQSTGPA